MRGMIYLEDGTYYEGEGFGKEGISIGEVVFNTSMMGYQEMITDPSCAGQIINMTYPLIGNYGVSEIDNESKDIYARGLIVKNISSSYSNYLATENIDAMLKKMEVVGISNIDTRALTKKIREKGALKCVISNMENVGINQLKQYLLDNELNTDYMNEVSTKEIINIKGNGKKVALLDFGVKNSIIESLKCRDCDITIFPYNTSCEDVLKINPDGVLLSNGPGNPKDVIGAIKMVKDIMTKLPIFGIGLGHQIVSLSGGANTYKMKYGHRGANHGVYDIDKDRAYVTHQNHGFAIDKDSLNNTDFVITHINLNDNTVEGIKHKYLPVFSVQFHPDGSLESVDTSYLFDKFIDNMKGV